MCEQEFTMYFSTFSKKKKKPKRCLKRGVNTFSKKKKKRGVNKKDKPS